MENPIWYLIGVYVFLGIVGAFDRAFKGNYLKSLTEIILGVMKVLILLSFFYLDMPAPLVVIMFIITCVFETMNTLDLSFLKSNHKESYLEKKKGMSAIIQFVLMIPIAIATVPSIEKIII